MFLSRATGETGFQALSFGGIVCSVWSSQVWVLEDSQREAPQLFLQKPSKLHEDLHIKVRAPTPEIHFLGWAY